MIRSRSGPPLAMIAGSVLAALLPGALQAQASSIAGRVTDVATGAAVEGVSVQAVSLTGATLGQSLTDAQGMFRVQGLRPGPVVLLTTRLGYAPRRLDATDVPLNGTTGRNIDITPTALLLNPIVVTASRASEDILRSPATISTVDQATVEARVALSPSDHVALLPGVSIARTGLVQSNVSLRGFTNVFSSQSLMLVDGRQARVPSLALNAPHFLPAVDEDIERVEVLLGPAAALYGPSSANGVVQFITRSPLDAQGTMVSMTGGVRSASQLPSTATRTVPDDRGLVDVRLRHAGLLGNAIGYKISGRYLNGSDWQNVDDVEVASRQAAIGRGALADTLSIGRRNFGIEQWSADGRVDYRSAGNTQVSVFGGMKSSTHLGISTVGASQARDWRYAYAHLQARRGRLFAQAFTTMSDAGDTYSLRTGLPTQDESREIALQVQNGAMLPGQTTLTYGVDYNHTDPRTSGTIHGRNEDNDKIDEVGGYAHLDVPLPFSLSLITALRADRNSRLDDLQWSPRVALVAHPAEGHSLRVSFNRAFRPPSPVNFSLDVLTANLGLYKLRALGVPPEGWHFDRTCTGGIGSLCMRTPLGADPSALVAAEATRMWAQVVALLRAQGVDLSTIPAPSAAQVGSVLRSLNTTTGRFNPVEPSSVQDLQALQPEITSTFELGYKGLLSQRVLVTSDVYHTQKKNFVGSLSLQTPSVFFNTSDLATYLTPFVGAQSAASLAATIGGGGATGPNGIPIGTVTPANAPGASPDLFLTFRNSGELSVWGADLGVEGLLSDAWSVGGAYSYVSKDVIPIAGNLADTLALNSPRHGAGGWVSYESDRIGLNARLRAKVNGGFAQNSGVYRGVVESYTTVGAQLGYRLPMRPDVTVDADLDNVFNDYHAEFIGAPRMGRLFLLRVRYSF